MQAEIEARDEDWVEGAGKRLRQNEVSQDEDGEDVDGGKGPAPRRTMQSLRPAQLRARSSSQIPRCVGLRPVIGSW